MKKIIVTSAIAGMLLFGTTTNIFANTLPGANNPTQNTPGVVSVGTNSPTTIPSSDFSILHKFKFNIVNKHLQMDLVQPLGSSDAASYAMLQNGVKYINQAIDQGYLGINANGMPVLTQKYYDEISSISHTQPPSNNNLATPDVTVTNSGWWGIDLYFNQQETAQEIASLQNSSAVWGFAALVTGFVAAIPGVDIAASIITGISAGIVALGGIIIANDMQAADYAGTGVTFCVRDWGQMWFVSGYAAP